MTEPKWLTGKELRDRWQIKSFELFEHIKIGLQPYDITGNPKPPPDVSERVKKLKQLELSLQDAENPCTVWVDFECQDGGYEKTITLRECQSPVFDQMEEEVRLLRSELQEVSDSWCGYIPPEEEKDLQAIFGQMDRSLFLAEDVERYENLHRPTTNRTFPRSEITPIPTTQRVFQRKGDYWDVTFDGTTKHLEHREHVLYLVHLLQNPGRRMHVLELVGVVKADPVNREEHSTKLYVDEALDDVTGYNAGMSIAPFSDELSSEDIEKFREIGMKIWGDIDASDDPKIRAKKEEEFSKYKEYLRKNHELTVRESCKTIKLIKLHRARGLEVEKARKLVYIHIRNAKKAIGVLIPRLKDHLDKRVDTGDFCVYRSDGSEWDIRT